MRLRRIFPLRAARVSARLSLIVRPGKEVDSLHDHYISGYRVDGRSRSVTFEVARPGEDHNNRFSLLLNFSDVEGYFFEHDLSVNIVYSVEQQQITEFLRENAARFESESKWGWPLFWKGSTDKTAEFLAKKGASVWSISTSYGLSGWVVAREARVSEARA